MDVRYFTSGKLARKLGFTVVDLPCGFTPRALEFAKSGNKYVGMDLPATISEIEPAIMSLLDDNQKTLSILQVLTQPIINRLSLHLTILMERYA